MGKPKVGISLYTYGANLRAGKMTVKECIDHAASLNVEGIELVDKQHIPNYPYQSIHDLWDLRDYIESFGMKVSCYSTYIDTTIRSDLSATTEECIEMMLQDISETDALGAKTCRPIYYPPEFRIGGEFTREEKFIVQLKGMIEKTLYALEKYDVRFATEIHAPGKPEMFIKLVKAVSHERYGLVPDFSAWQTKGAPTEFFMSSLESLKEALGYAFHVHAKAHVFNENGEEPNTPYHELIPIIKKSGFNDYISAEYEGWWLGGTRDSRKMAEIHVELIKKYL